MGVESARHPVTETSLAHYFRQRISDYARRWRAPLQEDTCWYVGSLLVRFGRSEALFTYQDGRLTLRPLAQLYADALEAQSERERCLLLQQLGDVALFTGALFPDRYARHGIGRDYFQGMGAGAYDYLAGNAQRNRHVFADLSRRFGRLLDMIAHACARHQPRSNSEVLELYVRWMRRRDPQAARQLRELGVELPDERDLH